MKKKYLFLKALAITSAILGLIALSITVFLLFIDGKVSFLTPLNLEEASKVGDFVGGFVGIFWSISGILLLFITLRLQSDEFRETQKAITKQQFETTFFNMLNMLISIRSQIKLNNKGQTGQNIDSHEFITYALNQLKKICEENMVENENFTKEIEEIERKIDNIEQVSQLELSTLKGALNQIYLQFYTEYHSELGHYFRYIYNLIKFTINNRKPNLDEKIYLDLIQAQLSNDEMALLFYNCLSDKGVNQQKRPQFFMWLEEYSFLENLDEKSLLKRAHHKLFPKTIFKFLSLDEKKDKMSNTEKIL